MLQQQAPNLLYALYICVIHMYGSKFTLSWFVNKNNMPIIIPTFFKLKIKIIHFCDKIHLIIRLCFQFSILLFFVEKMESTFSKEKIII